MSHEIRRKVQKMGKVSLSITLPKTWIEKNGLQSGDELILSIRKEGKLVITTPNKKGDEQEERFREKVIDISSIEGEYLSQKIIASYLSGYRVIRLKSNSMISEKKLGKLRK